MRRSLSPPVYGLTPSQADCARVIAALTDFEGTSPSFAEIAAELGIANKSGVHRLVHQLIERGWIDPYELQGKRALRLTRPPPPFNGNPITITKAGRAYLEDAA